MSDEMASKFYIKMNEVIDKGKRSKRLSEVKTVKNISKNPEFSRDKYCEKGMHMSNKYFQIKGR